VRLQRLECRTADVIDDGYWYNDDDDTPHRRPAAPPLSITSIYCIQLGPSSAHLASRNTPDHVDNSLDFTARRPAVLSLWGRKKRANGQNCSFLHFQCACKPLFETFATSCKLFSTLNENVTFANVLFYIQLDPSCLEYVSPSEKCLARCAKIFWSIFILQHRGTFTDKVKAKSKI